MLPNGKILIHNNKLYMNNEQISPYCGTIIHRGNGSVNITFPTCNYIYICVLCPNSGNGSLDCSINVLLDLNRTIGNTYLYSYSGTRFDNLDYGRVSNISYSNTSVSFNVLFADWLQGSYRLSYNCNVYYVCFS